MQTEMEELKFAEGYNKEIMLADPPAVHSEFMSMIHGLKEYCLATTLILNPEIYQGLIKEF